MRTSSSLITSLKPNEVFVFGSNKAGKHYGGAARIAVGWGAEMGNGYGLQGQTYAIPTLDENHAKLSLNELKYYVDEFIAFAKNHPDKDFLVTEIGCGIAGFKVEEIAPLFSEAKTVENILLPERFV